MTFIVLEFDFRQGFGLGFRVTYCRPKSAHQSTLGMANSCEITQGHKDLPKGAAENLLPGCAPFRATPAER